MRPGGDNSAEAYTVLSKGRLSLISLTLRELESSEEVRTVSRGDGEGLRWPRHPAPPSTSSSAASHPTTALAVLSRIPFPLDHFPHYIPASPFSPPSSASATAGQSLGLRPYDAFPPPMGLRLPSLPAALHIHSYRQDVAHLRTYARHSWRLRPLVILRRDATSSPPCTSVLSKDED